PRRTRRRPTPNAEQTCVRRCPLRTSVEALNSRQLVFPWPKFECRGSRPSRSTSGIFVTGTTRASRIIGSFSRKAGCADQTGQIVHWFSGPGGTYTRVEGGGWRVEGEEGPVSFPSTLHPSPVNAFRDHLGERIMTNRFVLHRLACLVALVFLGSLAG